MNRQYNDQQKEDKKANKTQKTKDWSTQISLISSAAPEG